MALGNSTVLAIGSLSFQEWAGGTKPAGESESVKLNRDLWAALDARKYDPNVQQNDRDNRRSGNALASLAAQYGVGLLYQVTIESIDTETANGTTATDAKWNALQQKLFTVKIKEESDRRYSVLPPWDVRNGQLQGTASIKLEPHWTDVASTLSDLLCCMTHAVLRHGMAGALSVHYIDGENLWTDGDLERRLADRWYDIEDEIQWRIKQLDL